MFQARDIQRLMGAPEDVQGPATGGRSAALQTDVNAIATLIEASQGRLAQDLLGCIYVQTPEFFERLIIDVLLAMGYGNNRESMARCVGRSGDGGIDGVIDLDELGLDSICIQAKRLKPGVALPISALRDFAGSLEAHHASKGVLVTTTHFPEGAQAFCSRISRRVVLIDGVQLTRLMIRHNIGVAMRECFALKEIDMDYFRPRP